MAKYSTALPVIFLASMKRQLPDQDWVLPAWYIAVLVNSSYSFWWDIIMDWGLLEVRIGVRIRISIRCRVRLGVWSRSLVSKCPHNAHNRL